MADNPSRRRSIVGTLRTDMKNLTTWQMVGIIVAVAISLVLVALDFASSCIMMLVVAIVLYMIPHFLRVTTSMKTITLAAFVVLSIIIGTFGYAGVVAETNEYINGNDQTNEYITAVSVEYDDAFDHYVISFEVNPAAAYANHDWVMEEDSKWGVLVYYTDISMVSFGAIGGGASTQEILPSEDLIELSGGWYSGFCVMENLNDGKYEYVQVYVIDGSGVEDLEDGEAMAGMAFTVDTGISSGDLYVLCLYGSAYTTILIAILFLIIMLLASTMRGSASRSRDRMEAEGRLYPQGYGRCKQCDAVVLPGEVVCRKCGAYIDVPEEMKPKKKDFVTCSECGAEVPADATSCPRCGTVFDEPEEVEVTHADGTVDATADRVPCPHCGEMIPANSSWCPKCGVKIKD